MNDGAITLDAIRAARERIAPHVLRTPLLRRSLRPDCELIAKAESVQATGSFKIRGAFSLMTTLPRDVPGVVAHSSGNHAQAVARAAAVLGLKAVVVMPADAPSRKRRAAESEGAEVVIVGSDADERAQRAEELAAERGLVPVPPFDHPLVIAGQGTAALELLEDSGPLDRFYAPVSGGGLLAGCAVAVHARQPGVEIVGVEPEQGNDVQLSLAAGERRKIPPPSTLADGLCVRTPGRWTWPVLRSHVARVELVSDAELLDAIRFALYELRVVLEPSGAAGLAVVLREGRGRCGVILSGGNVDPEILARAIGARP